MSYAWAYAFRMDLAPAVIGNGCLIKRGVSCFNALPAVERTIRRGVSGKRWLGITCSEITVSIRRFITIVSNCKGMRCEEISWALR